MLGGHLDFLRHFVFLLLQFIFLFFLMILTSKIYHYIYSKLNSERNDNCSPTITREGVFIFISKKLGEIDSEIGNEMLVALRRRISERRNKDMVSLMRFLQSSSISHVTIMNFVIPTNQQLSPKPRRPCNIYMEYNHRPTPTHLQQNFDPLQLATD
jgi:hypothetical protein